MRHYAANKRKRKPDFRIVKTSSLIFQRKMKKTNVYRAPWIVTDILILKKSNFVIIYVLHIVLAFSFCSTRCLSPFDTFNNGNQITWSVVKYVESSYSFLFEFYFIIFFINPVNMLLLAIKRHIKKQHFFPTIYSWARLKRRDSRTLNEKWDYISCLWSDLISNANEYVSDVAKLYCF